MPCWQFIIEISDLRDFYVRLTLELAMLLAELMPKSICVFIFLSFNTKKFLFLVCAEIRE